MEGLLNPVSTARKVQANIDRFETLSISNPTKSASNSTKSKRSILEITTPNVSDASSESPDLRPSTSSSKTSLSIESIQKKHKRHDSAAFLQKSYLDKQESNSLPDDARVILKDQPDHEDLYAVLQYLQYGIEGKHEFNILATGPRQSQIVNALVAVVVPAHWHVLRNAQVSGEITQLKSFLVSCLRSVAGLGALLLQVKKFSCEGSTSNKLLLEDMLSLLDHVLHGSHLLLDFLTDTNKIYEKVSQRRLYWQEVVALLAGSKILSVTAQAMTSFTNGEFRESIWIANGSDYSHWLAKNISVAMMKLNPLETESWVMLSQVMKRSLNIGYRDHLISQLYSCLLFESKSLWTPLQTLLSHLSAHEQKIFFDAVLRDLARKHFRPELLDEARNSTKEKTNPTIGGVAAMIVGLIQNNAILEEHISEWLTNINGEYAGLGIDTRRAVIATIASDHVKLERVLEKCMTGFGDKLQIQHNPILQQESTTQIILLVTGYLYRLNPESVKTMSKSSLFLQCVSYRLAASVPRARFLGMLVGVAVSKLVDSLENAMKFDMEELKSEEAQIWLRLIYVHDPIGDITVLKQNQNVVHKQNVVSKTFHQPLQRRAPKTPVQAQTSKIIAIEEVHDEEDEEDEELLPYPKPDNDSSDSEEDPTLIDRSKPSAPVYIVDLVRQLQVQDKPDIIELALRTASSLIRRKAEFGTELSTNVHELLSALTNIQDTTSDTELQQHRLNALIACLVSIPITVGPWAASTYFEGDFSLVQRAALLTMVGLGSRELAGYNDGGTNSGTGSSPKVDFPSNRLPSHLALLYAPLSTITTEIQHNMLQPLALAAADKLTGPDILKIRTFSSRMAVEKKNLAKAEQRSKRIPRDLHKILSDSIYLPFCCRMSLLLNSRVNISRSNVFEPHIFRLFIQTLTILMVCLGPNAIQLPSVTRETLIFLLALHNTPTLAHDPVVLPAMLQLLLTTLDLNIEAGVTAEERLVTEFGSMCAELIRWAAELDQKVNVPVASGDSMISDGDGGRGAGGMPWSVVVAGIQVKWHEIGKKFQGRMLGLMGGEMEF